MNEQFKKRVKNQVLEDLEQYFEEAAEHEDPEVLNDPDIRRRVRDFGLYLYETSKQEQTIKQYTAMHVTRKGPPRVEGTITAMNLEDAIKGLDLWPYTYPDDFIDEYGNVTKTYEEALKIVVEYVKGLGHGNGESGYWNVYLETDNGTAKFAHEQEGPYDHKR